jgi:hypothetical protein
VTERELTDKLRKEFFRRKAWEAVEREEKAKEDAANSPRNKK